MRPRVAPERSVGVRLIVGLALLASVLTMSTADATPRRASRRARARPATVSPTTTEARRVLEACQTLASRLTVGLNYQDYTREVGNLQVAFDRFERQPGAAKHPAYPHLALAVTYYRLAQTEWQLRIDGGPPCIRESDNPEEGGVGEKYWRFLTRECAVPVLRVWDGPIGNDWIHQPNIERVDISREKEPAQGTVRSVVVTMPDGSTKRLTVTDEYIPYQVALNGIWGRTRAVVNEAQRQMTKQPVKPKPRPAKSPVKRP